MMYAGALWWIICIPIAFLILLFVAFATAITFQLVDDDDDDDDWMIPLPFYLLWSALILPTLWLGQWLFLAGFVKLMGPL